LLPAAAALDEEVRARSQRVAIARRAARSWHVWRSGERRGAAVGGVALAPMRPCRARCIIAPAAAAHGEEVRALAHKG